MARPETLLALPLDVLQVSRKSALSTSAASLEERQEDPVRVFESGPWRPCSKPC